MLTRSTAHRLSLVVSTVVSAAVVTASPAWAAPIKVACVGEQTTHSDQLNRAVEYPAMLEAKLGAGYDAENFGDCCATVLTGYPKQSETHPFLSGGTAPSYTQSLTFAPDVVVVGSWGKHDTEIADSLYAGVLDPVKFQADYETLVTTYLNLASKPVVYVSTPVPIPKGAPTGVTTTVILPTVKAIAAKYNLPIVDLYSVFLNQPQLYKDDTHVADDAGLQAIAETVFAEMTDGGAPETDGGAVDTTDAAPADPGSGGSGDDASEIQGGDGGAIVAPNPPLGAAPPGPASPAGASSGGGCAVAPGSAAPGGAAAWLLAACAGLVRWRRPRAPDDRRPSLSAKRRVDFPV
jgi:hypothetical protein